MTDTAQTPPAAAPEPGLDSFDLYVRSVEATPELDPDTREVLAAGVLVDNALRVAEKIVYARLGLNCRAGEAGSRSDPTREAGRAAVLQVAARILDVWTVRVTAHPPLPPEAEPEAAPEAGEHVPLSRLVPGIGMGGEEPE